MLWVYRSIAGSRWLRWIAQLMPGGSKQQAAEPPAASSGHCHYFLPFPLFLAMHYYCHAMHYYCHCLVAQWIPVDSKSLLPFRLRLMLIAITSCHCYFFLLCHFLQIEIEMWLNWLRWLLWTNRKHLVWGARRVGAIWHCTLVVETGPRQKVSPALCGLDFKICVCLHLYLCLYLSKQQQKTSKPKSGATHSEYWSLCICLPLTAQSALLEQTFRQKVSSYFNYFVHLSQPSCWK